MSLPLREMCGAGGSLLGWMEYGWFVRLKMRETNTGGHMQCANDVEVSTCLNPEARLFIRVDMSINVKPVMWGC